MAMVVLILEYMGWPFVLQFSSSPLVFDSSPFSSGCLLRWGRFRWPWGKFIFCSALSLIWSISLTLRHEFDFCSALTSIGSISLSLRHDFNFLQCAYFNGVDRFDPKARFWFLQCADFGRVDFIDPEARDYFLQWITLLTSRLRAFWKFWSQIVH